MAILTAILVLSQPMMAQSLPEGDSGIAAHYSNDLNIKGDAAVLLHEDFESVDATSLSDYNSVFDAVYGDNKITGERRNVHGGSKAVERTHTTPTSFGAVKHLGVGYEKLHLRYYMKYHAKFPGCHHTGGGIYATAGEGYKQIGSITGVKPDGTNHCQAWLDEMTPYFDWNPKGNDTPPGWLNIYCYNPDQGHEYGDILFPDGLILPGYSKLKLSDEFEARPNYNPERGAWHCFEIMMRLNTPGKKDGRVAFWVDGKLVGDFPGLRLRETEELKLNHVAISTYSSQLHDNKTIWYDDVVAATSYIGPMVSAAKSGAEDSKVETRD